MSKITWNDVKEFVNNLTDAQLAKSAFVLIDDNSTGETITGLETIGEDIYCNKEDDEDCATLEELREIHGADFNEEDYELVTEAGHPFIWLDADVNAELELEEWIDVKNVIPDRETKVTVKFKSGFGSRAIFKDGKFMSEDLKAELNLQEITHWRRNKNQNI